MLKKTQQSIAKKKDLSETVNSLAPIVHSQAIN